MIPAMLFPETALFFLDRICLNQVAEAVTELSKDDRDPRKGGVLAIVVIDPNHHISPTLASLSVGESVRRMVWHAKHAHEKIEEAHSDLVQGCINPAVAYNEAGYEVYISFSGASRQIDDAISFVISEKLGLKVRAYESSLLERTRQLLEHVVVDD